MQSAPTSVGGWLAVDLPPMIGTSGSMSEEQASLGTEPPRLVAVLVSGDRTGDGPTADDFPPVNNLHVGARLRPSSSRPQAP